MRKVLSKGQGTHQGDIYIRSLTDEEAKNVKLEGKEIKKSFMGKVIHHGEALGAYHTFRDEDDDAVTLLETGKDEECRVLYAEVKKEISVTHEIAVPNPLNDPHDEIVLKPGLYKIKTQQEQREGFLRPSID